MRSGSSSSSSSRMYHSPSPECCLRQGPHPQEGPQSHPDPARLLLASGILRYAISDSQSSPLKFQISRIKRLKVFVSASLHFFAQLFSRRGMTLPPF